MKLVLGIVSLLIVLVIVGKLGVTQLAALRGAPAAVAGDAASATVRASSRGIQGQIQTDITKALEQGAAARRDAPDQ